MSVERNSGVSAFQRLRSRLADFPEVVALISFLLIFLYFVVYADNFLTIQSLSNIATLASIKGILVIGVAMLMISGEFDLSVGAIFAIAAYVFALSIQAGMPIVPAMILALFVSGLLGYINGYIVTRTRIPSFIMTLGTMLAYRGIARSLGGGEYARFDIEANGYPQLFSILNGPIDSINNLVSPTANLRISVFWFIGLTILMAVFMAKTVYGNWVYATGGNAGAALAQGINTKAVIVRNFIISGLFAGFAGIVQFAWRVQVDPLRGEGWELVAVAACVIGGIWLEGGFGTIVGAAIGIVLLQMVEQGLILIGVDIQLFQAALGVILIFAVLSSTYLSRR